MPDSLDQSDSLDRAVDSKTDSVSSAAKVQVLTVRDSSTIDVLTYCEVDSVMTVGFKSGSIYRYDGVSKEAWDKFSSAESKGSHFAREIKPRYTGRKL